MRNYISIFKQLQMGVVHVKLIYHPQNITTVNHLL